ncbi:HTH-type transcriptional repressor KstR [Nocardia cerradoensis]|uniref:HTH-type transcriptional repressor KstR n=1 Tax=Nocardia cerradoensis TaxID=85688 RepID=A0A231GU85_9NOCA|nr:TetR/AcrR family transcriptional regulator [Nocardia cerradoensis]OXR40176.1 HTH-type transcriptional repressor KstR [Nocardia cerradoensis]
MSSEVRRRILDVTLDLIGHHGIDGLSNRIIAKGADVSLGTLTYHFASREDLLVEALQLFVDDEINRLTILASRIENDPTGLGQVLANAREAIEDQAARTKQVAQLELYLHSTRHPGLQEAAARCFQAYDNVATSALRALGIPEPERLAPLLGALIDGFELRRLAVGGLGVDLTEGLSALVTGLGAERSVAMGVNSDGAVPGSV